MAEWYVKVLVSLNLAGVLSNVFIGSIGPRQLLLSLWMPLPHTVTSTSTFLAIFAVRYQPKPPLARSSSQIRSRSN